MSSIKFDTTEIRNTIYAPRFVKHESAAERILDTLKIAREDGEVLISDRRGIKKIQLVGILTGSSQSDLETKIDNFKELFSRPEKNLDIDWAGGTMRFVATCARHDFDRDHFHILIVPWSAEFEVLSGEGKSTTTTMARNEAVLTTTTPVADSFTLAGSKIPKPKITIQGNNFSNLHQGIEYKNTDTGERIVITRNKAWGGTGKIIIDCALKKVTDNIASAVFNEGNFYGVFPKFKIGTNNIQISVGGIVNQQTGEISTGDAGFISLDSTSKYLSQSFSVPYKDPTFSGITVMLGKEGSPGNITWRIETDNGNKPSGSLAHGNASGTITAASVGGAPAYITSYSSGSWTIEANIKYWLVLRIASGNSSNRYLWGGLSSSGNVSYLYPKGEAKQSNDSGATWSSVPSIDDFCFKIRYGGQPDVSSIKHSVEYTKTYL